MNGAKAILLSARWVFPVTSEPIEYGAVAIRHDRIEAVGRREDLSSRPDADFEERHYTNGAILPGLINLHSHLDYAHQRFLNSSDSLFDWIPKLIESTAGWSVDRFIQSASYGASLSALSGITTIADSSYSGAAAEAIAALGLRGTVGLELFGLDDKRTDEIWENWLQKLETRVESASSALKEALQKGRVRLTVAPHAPYTVSPALWRKAKQWSDRKRLPLLAHVAESVPECLWVSGREPRVDQFLLGVMPPGKDRDTSAVLSSIDWKGIGLSPVEHLQHHALLNENTIAAHCVQVNDADLEILKTARAAIAHCPRSNARLRNGRAPLEKFRRHALLVGLGTDSLASCDDLNLLQEARFALNLHRAACPDLSLTSSDLLALITIEAARALGQAEQIGSLEPGKKADLAVFKLEDREEPAGKQSANGHRSAPSPSDPADLMIRSGAAIDDLFVDGRQIAKAGCLRKSALAGEIITNI